MNASSSLRLAGALGTGALGGFVATLVGLPAPWLTGPTILVSVASLLFLKVDVPRWLRDCGFTVIGLSIGSGVDDSILGRIVGWAPSLVAVVACSALVMILSSAFLTRFGRMDPATAKLASSPGALGYAVALAMEGRGDVSQVMFIQSARLFAMTAILPPLLAVTGDPVIAPHAHLSLMEAAVLLALAFPLGGLCGRFRVPAAHLLGGMAVSAAAHLSGLAHGLAPTTLTNPAYLVTGTMIGTRFGRNAIADLIRLIPPALGSVTIALAVAGGFAAAIAWMTGMPFAQAWIALAPGGVEAMAAMALALGFEPAFVAAHHFLRITFLSLVIPAWLRPSRSGRGPR